MNDRLDAGHKQVPGTPLPAARKPWRKRGTRSVSRSVERTCRGGRNATKNGPVPVTTLLGSRIRQIPDLLFSL
jgi:hypothetical protein